MIVLYSDANLQKKYEFTIYYWLNVAKNMKNDLFVSFFVYRESFMSAKIQKHFQITKLFL